MMVENGLNCNLKFKKLTYFDKYIYKTFIFSASHYIKIYVIDSCHFANEVAKFIILKKIEMAKSVIMKNRKFTLALSGGVTPIPVYRCIAQLANEDGSLIRGIWIQVDERDVEPTNENSNQKSIYENLFNLYKDFNEDEKCNWIPFPINLKNNFIYKILARKYKNKLKELKDSDINNSLLSFGYDETNNFLFSKFDENFSMISKEKVIDKYKHIITLFTHNYEYPADIAILGIGEDGHTASIFPDVPLNDHMICTDWFTWIRRSTGYSRYTMTFNTLLEIPCLIFLVSGYKKNQISKIILQGICEYYENHSQKNFTELNYHENLINKELLRNYIPSLELIKRRKKMTYLIFDDLAGKSF